MTKNAQESGSYCTRCSMSLLPAEPYPTGLRMEQALCAICAQTYEPRNPADKNILIVGHIFYAKLLEIERRLDALGAATPEKD